MTLWNDRYTAQVNGSNVGGSSYTGQYGSGKSTKNNGGTIRQGGTIVTANGEQSRAPFNSASLGDTDSLQLNVVVNSSGFAGDLMVTQPAVAAGTFAKMTVDKYIIRRVTTTIAGVNNTVLQSGGSDYGIRRSIAAVESWRTSYLAQLQWAKNSSNAGLPVYTFVYSDHVTADGQNSSSTNPASLGTVDEASVPTLATPGQLVYRTGAPAAYQDVYKPKYGGG